MNKMNCCCDVVDKIGGDERDNVVDGGVGETFQASRVAVQP